MDIYGRIPGSKHMPDITGRYEDKIAISRKMIREGKSLEEISNRVGLKKTGLTNFFKRNGIIYDGKSAKKDHVKNMLDMGSNEKLVYMVENDIPLTMISQELGYGGTIDHKIIRNIKIRAEKIGLTLPEEKFKDRKKPEKKSSGPRKPPLWGDRSKLIKAAGCR